MAQPSIRLAHLAATLPLLASAGAFAQAAAPVDPLRHIAPHERRAYVEQLVARQRAARLQAGAAAADITPPVLTAFNAATKLALDKADAKFKVAVKATDDMSGVMRMYFYASGPSGQSISFEAIPGYPAKSVNVAAGPAWYQMNRFLEPGTWVIAYGYGYDVADNWASFDGATLAALGNTTFTVVNNGGYDRTVPVLTGGKIITSAVSLSKHQPGTTQHRYAGASLSGTDAGNGALSGIQSGNAYFCQLADTSQCIYLYGEVTATGQASANFTVGTQIQDGNVAGDYELRHVYLYDRAGNTTYLTSDKFGGSTDFSTMFPTTVITLTP